MGRSCNGGRRYGGRDADGVDYYHQAGGGDRDSNHRSRDGVGRAAASFSFDDCGDDGEVGVQSSCLEEYFVHRRTFLGVLNVGGWKREVAVLYCIQQNIYIYI